MAYGRARRSTTYGEFWPGYVDVLSTLLLVVTFLMSVFMVAQFYVSQEATGKDTALRRLTRQIAELTNLLSLEKGKGKSLEDELASAAGVARHAQERERAARRPRRRQSATRTRASPRLTKELGDQKGMSERGAGQGRPAQPAAAGAAPPDGGAAGGARTRPRPRTRRARRASPTSAPASTSCWPARCRSCSAIAPTSSAACASCCATARTSASSATASCSSPRCCSPPARPP